MVALAIALCGQASADKWVDAVNGNDANSGDAPGVGNAYATIQKGIDTVADAGRVHVAAGKYVETGQIVIDSDLTIIGDASDKPIIKPGQDTGSSGDSKGWWLVNAGVDLNIQDLVLDGSGHNVFQGIRAWGTGTGRGARRRRRRAGSSRRRGARGSRWRGWRRDGRSRSPR